MLNFISNTIQLHIATYNKISSNWYYLVLRRADNVLIYPNLWQVVTGNIEANETAVQAALRESEEETGFCRGKLFSIPYVAQFFLPAKNAISSAPVMGLVVENPETVKISIEHDKFEWLNFEDCIRILELPSHREGTRIFRDYILNNRKCEMFRIPTEQLK